MEAKEEEDKEKREGMMMTTESGDKEKVGRRGEEVRSLAEGNLRDREEGRGDERTRKGGEMGG